MGVDKEVQTLPKGISLKVNIIAKLEFKLIYFEAVIKFFSYDVTETPPHFMFVSQIAKSVLQCVLFKIDISWWWLQTESSLDEWQID